jgi:hypothetical protein
LAASPDLQLLVTAALMVDAFILGAAWQLLSDPVKRQNIFRRFSRPKNEKTLLELEN